MKGIKIVRAALLLLLAACMLGCKARDGAEGEVSPPAAIEPADYTLYVNEGANNIRFFALYPDGRAKTAAISAKSDRDSIAGLVGWFNKADNLASSGEYSLEGGVFACTTESRLGLALEIGKGPEAPSEEAPDRRIDWEGMIDADGNLRLTSYSHINGETYGEELFVFMGAVRGDVIEFAAEPE